MTIQQGFPSVAYSWVDKDGKLTQPAYQFLLALWNRTGGGGGGISVTLFGDVTGDSGDTSVVSTHLTDPLPIAQGGTASSTAAGARTSLGLGSMATQNADAVAITGGSGAFTTLDALSGSLQAGGIDIVTTNTALARLSMGNGAARFEGDTSNATIYAADGSTGLLQISDAGDGVATPNGFYDTGTWTPIDSSGAGLSFSSTFGSYVRIGALVICHFTLTFPATASGATALIGGLPFTTSNYTNGAQSGATGYSTDTVANYLFINGNATTFSVYTTGGAARTNADLTTDTLRGSLIFETAR